MKKTDKKDKKENFKFPPHLSILLHRTFMGIFIILGVGVAFYLCLLAAMFLI